MRPRYAVFLLAAAVFYLVLAIWPFQLETRLVGVAGAVLFALMLAAERRRGRRRQR